MSGRRVLDHIKKSRSLRWGESTPSDFGFLDLHFSYNDGGVVFAGASLEASGPGVTALYGPNGRGKTTALRILAGYYKAQQGKIYPPDSIRTLSFSGADGGDLPPYSRCLDVLEYCLVKSQDSARVLADLGLRQSAKQRIHTLSSGQKKRLSLFRALVTGRDGILLDEPLAHLDVIAQRELLDALEILKTDTPIVVATHSPLIAQHLVQDSKDALFWVDGYRPSGGKGRIDRLRSIQELDARTGWRRDE